MRDMKMEFKDERDMELQHGPDSHLKEVLTSIGYFSLGFSIVLFMSPIKAVILAALFSITVRIIEELGIDILGTFKKVISKLVIKPIKLIGGLILVLPIVIVAAIVMSYPKDSTGYDNYKERMTNASEEKKIFATNSTLDKVADHKLGEGDLVDMSEEEKQLVKENYIMKEKAEEAEDKAKIKSKNWKAQAEKEVEFEQLSDGRAVTKEANSQVTVWEEETQEGDSQ